MKESKNKSFLRQLKENIEQEKTVEKEVETAISPYKENKFDQGLNITREIMSGSKIKTPRLLVETSQCRMWEHHNRAFELLNEIRCKELIDQFKEMGKQEFPAIVRLVENEGEIKYEIICGARRYWTCKYLGWKYFVEIRELTDEEAFRLSDIENRAREDISDYERALDYKNALSHYYQNQVQMANRLEVTPSWLSRYLDLADLQEEIVSAYRDITEIKVIHARKLKPYFNGAGDNKIHGQRIIEKALSLKGLDYDGSKVIAELLSAVVTKARRSRPKIHHSSKSGLVNLQVRVRKDKKIELLIDKVDKATKDEVLELISATLEQYF